MKPLLTKSILLVLSIIVSAKPFAQSVIPNINFGNNGKAITNYTNDAPTYSSCIALQQDGKMVIGGNTIVRVSPNGVPDNTFNTNGFYFDPSFNTAPESITERAGVITAIYSGDINDTAITLRRLTALGKPDNSYGNNGTVRYALPGLKLNGYKNILQADGKMLLMGSAVTASNTDVFVARFLQNGLPDTSFNHTGYLIIPFANGVSAAYTGAVQSGGDIIVTGVYINNITATQQLFVIKIKPNGIVDNSFNSTGVYFPAGFEEGFVVAKAITIQTGNKILIAANAAEQILVIRLKADGSPDETFNSTGTLITYLGVYNNPSGIFVRTNNKIVISAETEISNGDPSSRNYAALQLLEDGSPDNSFSSDGKMYASVSVHDHCVGAALQDDGRLVLTGYADEANLITMVGVDTTGEVDFNFGSGGIKILQLLGTNDNLISLLQHTDKKIIVVGTKNQAVLDKTNMILMRYKEDGSGLDSTFGFNGKAGIRRDNKTLVDAGIQQTGKIIACETFYDATAFNYRTAVFRFTELGYLDYSFAPATNFLFQGEPSLNIPAAKKIAVYDDDKILMAQNNADVGSNISVTKLTPDGEPDLFFGNNGTKVLEITAANYTFNNLVLQNDKKIVLAVKNKIDDTTTGYALIRLNEDGEFDNSFDTDGIKDLPFTSHGNGDSYNVALAMHFSGKIITGTTIINFNESTAMYDTSVVTMQLKTNGTADSSFNETGILNIPPVNESGIVLQTIAAYPNADIYISGNTHDLLQEQKGFLMRLTPKGDIDSTITGDASGILFTNTSANCYNKDLKILQDSTILTGSNLFNGSNNNDYLLSAYKARKLTVYRFIGDGDWTDAANWEKNIVPPAILPSNGFIFINPVASGKCNLNIDQQLQQGSCIVVMAGKNLIVTGNLIIN